MSAPATTTVRRDARAIRRPPSACPSGPRRLRAPGALALLACAAGLWAAAAELRFGAVARADEGRFDAQTFRPSGAPQDLVMVPQSRPLSHRSVAIGSYLSFSLDPLGLVRPESGKRVLSIVANRLELDLMAMVGLYGWGEVGAVLPVVLLQTSDNLADIGSEGSIQSTAIGDLRLTGKVAIPGLRRKAEGKGWGGALTLQVSLPTGVAGAFTSDGAVTWQPGAVFDYRFGSGILVALDVGLWLRPTHELATLEVGDLVSGGLALEVPVVRRWGIGVLGEVFANLPFTYFRAAPKDVPPVEGLLGFRWYSSSGFTLTVGGGGGDCGFGSPSVRFFVSLVWVPTKTQEWEAIERFKDPPPPDPDPDKDGLIGARDKCPLEAGPVENFGCPDKDTDHDGVVDRLDKCPVDPSPGGADEGCPRARIHGHKILFLDAVHFATDADVILPDSFAILEAVAGVILAHPELLVIDVEGHTDSRADDAYNLDLSRRRAESVVRFLVARGVEAPRLHAVGYGRRRPITTNDTEEGMALNRRVEFTIVATSERGAPRPGTTPGLRPQPKPYDGVLPGRDAVLPDRPTLPSHVLPDAPRAGSVLPSRAPTAPPPSRGVLQRSKKSGPVRSTAPGKPHRARPVMPSP